MDYHARHGHDVCNFDLPSTHRLPTVSAADALEVLDGDASTHVSTGLPDLDRALSGNASSQPLNWPAEKGGLSKGQVTEIWGPPGVGKTTMGIQAATNVLRDGKSVVWVDCFHLVCRERLTELCTEAATEDEKVRSDPLGKLVHFSSPSLAHFIALLCRPTRSSVPSDTALIVVDSISALINHAFPKGPPPKAAAKGNSRGPTPSSRRIQVLQYIVGALQKLAATRNAPVVVLTQCATQMQAERGATLIPAINANVWEQGIATRIVLFRDWVWNDGRASGARLATVQKINGKVDSNALDKVYAFDIESRGVVALDYDGIQPAGAFSYTQKRKLDETGFEIPDSEDEDYGWQGEDDNALPGPPPQWQGSEDILLGHHPEAEDNEDQAEGDSEHDLQIR